ncbi:MAG: hypothetical protein HZA90_07355 [Verrucomicrobia bacterium]|nr:hypothetical protein [Verrucomicrobiota bacterium]
MNWKWAQFSAVATLAVVAGLAMGCSGINASKSVSPASFLLPGLIRNAPAPEPLDLSTPAPTNVVVALAQ